MSPCYLPLSSSTITFRMYLVTSGSWPFFFYFMKPLRKSASTNCFLPSVVDFCAATGLSVLAWNSLSTFRKTIWYMPVPQQPCYQTYINLHFISISFFLFWDRRIDHIYWFNTLCSPQPRLGQAEARSLEFHQDFPHGRQEPMTMSQHLLPPRVHLNRKLDWKHKALYQALGCGVWVLQG